MSVKVCRTCGIEQPLEDLYVNKPKYGNRKNTCKECDKAANKERNRVRKDGENPPAKSKPKLNSDADWAMSILTAFCKSKGRTLDLTLEEIDEMIHRPCVYCGSVDEREMSRKRTGKFNSINRVDSNLEYTFSNVVSCCGQCDIMKGTLSDSEFVDKGGQITKWHVQHDSKQ